MNEEIPINFNFKGEELRLEKKLITRFENLKLCLTLDKQTNSIPKWMEPNSLRLFIYLAKHVMDETHYEILENNTGKILKMLWYSDYFGLEEIQSKILIDYIWKDLHVLNAAVYLHEGLKKIANTRNTSKAYS